MPCGAPPSDDDARGPRGGEDNAERVRRHSWVDGSTEEGTSRRDTTHWRPLDPTDGARDSCFNRNVAAALVVSRTREAMEEWKYGSDVAAALIMQRNAT